mmetsp:Transcript_52331/g.96859  ORF Transcript_52331/g.96859 Transcript_52331/m.96859 type:complete len:265 (+) Transcript_52331:104-898(+)
MLISLEGDGQCRLLGSLVSWVCQVILGLTALAVLIVKRYIEVPRRPCLVWFFDVGKQAGSSAVDHVMNILLGYWLADAQSHHGSNDECAWYCVNFTVDIVIGIWFCLGLLRLSELIAVRCGCEALSQSGDYGDPPSLLVAIAQLLIWCCCFLVMKVSIAATIVYVNPVQDGLNEVADYFFGDLNRTAPQVELAFVMVLWPLLLNSLYFWVSDRLIKAASESYDLRALCCCCCCGRARRGLPSRHCCCIRSRGTPWVSQPFVEST